jgi:cytochrome d ubiquinol oxidase subunit II
MLETTWFVIWGVLWAVYFMLDGFDFGLGSLMPFLAKNEEDRVAVYNALGPFWDGNEVWLITAGGVTFAAFPKTYAVMFSALYSPLMLILFALILRGVALGYREEAETQRGKRAWDVCTVVSSFLPALLFGVAFGNIFQGIAIDGDGVFQGNLLTLLNPYALAGGVLFVMLFFVHGSLWLATKSDGELQERAGKMAKRLWPVLLIVAVVFLIWTFPATKLYINYIENPILFVIPLLAVVGLVLTRLFIAKSAWWKAWFASSLAIVSVTMFGVIGLYPSLLPSNIDSAYSLTIYNSSSSPMTLKIMLAVVLTFVPIIIAYQVWKFKFFKDKLSEEDTGYGSY